MSCTCIICGAVIDEDIFDNWVAQPRYSTGGRLISSDMLGTSLNMA